MPGDNATTQQVRETIVRLHDKLLGEQRPLDHTEIERTFQLFTGIISDAKAQPNYEPRETYFCGGREDFHVDDPHYTVRAWRGVVTYLLRQHEFLYE